MLSHSAWPEVTRLDSTGEIEKLTYLFKSILILSLLGGVIYLVLVQNLGEGPYNWWLNHKLPYDPMVMFMMGCFVILTTIWTLGANLLLATNDHEGYARLHLPINLFALWLCYRGAVAYGLQGAVMGLIFGQSIPMIGIVILFLKRKGWGIIAVSVLRLSIVTIIILPMCLNLWAGLTSIALLAVFTLRQFGWRPSPLQ